MTRTLSRRLVPILALAVTSGWLAPLASVSLAEEAPAVHGQLEHRLSHDRQGRLVQNRSEATLGTQGQGWGPWEWAVEGRLRRDLCQTSTGYCHEVFWPAAYGRYQAERWNLKVGFQELAWGQMLGPSLLDLAQPRDLRDPAAAFRADQKLPVAMATVTWQGDWLDAQGFFSPVPPRAKTMATVQSMAVVGDEHGRPPPEGGARVRYLGEGWDLGLHVARHASRTPFLRPGSRPEGPVLLRQELAQTSLGLGFSQALPQGVVRGEAGRFLLPAKATASLLPQATQAAQVAYDHEGWDHLLASLQLLAAQAETMVAGERQQRWLTLQLRGRFFEERLRPAFYLGERLGERGRYRRIEVEWQLLPALVASLEGESFAGENGSLLGALAEADRWGVGLGWAF